MEKGTGSLEVAYFGWAQFEAMGRPGKRIMVVWWV